MFLTVHTAAGLFIGKHFDNSVLAFILGFISHLILDIPPHDPDKFKDLKGRQLNHLLAKITFLIDVPLIIILLFVLYYFGFLEIKWPTILAVSGAVSVDFLWGFYLLFPKVKLMKIFYDLNQLSHIMFGRKFYLKLKHWLPVQLVFFLIFMVLYLL